MISRGQDSLDLTHFCGLSKGIIEDVDLKNHIAKGQVQKNGPECDIGVKNKYPYTPLFFTLSQLHML